MKVPTLIGSDVDDAIATIKAAGLGDGMIKYVDSDLPEGTVTFQSIDAGEEVKAGTVINLQASKGPEQAQEPLIRTLSQDAVVEQGDKLTLQVKAEAADDGELTYAWYVSESGNVADAELVSRSDQESTPPARSILTRLVSGTISARLSTPSARATRLPTRR